MNSGSEGELERKHDAAGARPARRPPLEIYGLLLLAGLLRFGDVGAKSLWVDEAQWYYSNQRPLAAITDLCRESHYPPLREYLLHFLGNVPRPQVEASIRTPSALAGTLMVPLVFALGRLLFGWEAGLCGALFLLIHPWQILHSQDSRMHAVFLFLATLTLYQVCRLLYGTPPKRNGKRRRALASAAPEGKGAGNPDDFRERLPAEAGTERAQAEPSIGGNGWKTWAGWALWGAAMALYSYLTYVVALAFVAFAGIIGTEWMRRLRQRERRPDAHRLPAGAALAAAVFLILYAPWLRTAVRTTSLYAPESDVGVAYEARPSNAGIAPSAPSEETSSPVAQAPAPPPPAATLPSPPPPPSPAESPYATHFNLNYSKRLLYDLGGRHLIGAAVAFALAAVGLVGAAARHRSRLAVPVWWFLAPLPLLLATEAGHFFPTRYLLFYLAIYAPLVGYGAALVIEGLQRLLAARARVPRHVAMATAACLVMAPLLIPESLALIDYYGAEKQDWRDAVGFLEQRMGDGDLLIVGDHWAKHGVAAYRNPNVRLRVAFPRDYSLGEFVEQFESQPNVWYVHWAILPAYIDRIVSSRMRVVHVFPGILGDVRILRKNPPQSNPFPVRQTP